MVDERRHETRVPMNRLVEVSLGKKTAEKASCLNISRNGILCRTSRQFEPTAHVVMQINVPLGFDSYNIGCEGTVVRSKREAGRYLNGIRFTDLPNESALALESFLKSYERETGSLKPLDFPSSG